MKLDEIQDIETLRNILKTTMCLCIKERELKNYESQCELKAAKDEWYFYEYDRESEDYTIYDEKQNYGYIKEDEFKEFFFLENHE